MKIVDRILKTVGLSRITGATPDFFAMDKQSGMRLGMKQFDRSLSKPYLDDTNNESYRCWSSNPLGRFIINTYVNHIVGDCITLTADKDESGELQDFLDDFKEKNKFDLLVAEMCRCLELFGELLPVPLVNNLNGDTTIGFIDPAQVKEIKANPKNWIDSEYVILTDLKAAPLKIIKVSKVNQEPTDRYINVLIEQLEGKMVGDVFYWHINRPIGASRGVGDLFPVIDMVNSAEELAWSAKTKMQLQTNAVLEVTFPNSWTQQKIRKAFTKGDPEYLGFPENPGEPFGHTENVKMNWLVPNIGAIELEKLNLLIMSMVEAGVNIPHHLWGQGNETNYATAAVMGSPFYRTMKARQVHFKACLTELIQFVIDQKLLFATPDDPIRKVKDFSFTVNLPEIDTEDESLKSTTLVQKMTAFLTALQGGAITQEQYSDLVQKEIRDAGFDLEEADTTPVPTKAEPPVYQNGKEPVIV